MIKQAIPNFSNKTALIIHRADGNVHALLSQLRRFNIEAVCQCAVGLTMRTSADDVRILEMPEQPQVWFWS